MAHNTFNVLEYLLKDLDDERNDIYLHIDKKVKNIDLSYDEEKDSIRNMFRTVFYSNLDYLKDEDKSVPICSDFLSKMSPDYRNNTSLERIVIDYIAGMTDEYFKKEYNKIIDKKSDK